MLGTVAGQVLHNFRCAIIENNEENVLLGNPALLSLDTYVHHQMEQVTSGIGQNGDDGDDIPSDPEIGRDTEDEITRYLNGLVEEAEEMGSRDVRSSLRRIIMEHRDVWCEKINLHELHRIKLL
ncbi:Hypothetical protein PHPALM_20303 [Phytophthora palmivora]|uniref:Uncharacterized protein n=1 Tax=Phytophthora palmivora TaxID=4796 RepID=A0A2P4XF86_9STRA|nr:Hypothetical protein PHPALM_20303 [Phytophthora palmivora]